MKTLCNKCCKWFGTGSESNLGSLALLILRIIVGLAMMFHGWGKIQNPFGWMGPEAPVPGIFQGLAALAEFGGGLSWIIGLLVPLSSIGMFFTMAVAALTHISMGDPFVSTGGGAYELATVYAAISLVLLFVGPGKYSLDRKLFKR